MLPCLGCKSSSKPLGQSCSGSHSEAGPALLLEPPPALVSRETPQEVLTRNSPTITN